MGRRFFIASIIIIISAVSLSGTFGISRAYAGTCSPPTQSQLLGMTTDSQVYGALSCLSTNDLYNLLTQPQAQPPAPALTQSQLDGVMNLLTSDQIGSLIASKNNPFSPSQSYIFLTDLGPAETYAFLDNITANTNPPVSQAQLTYDILYNLLNTSNPQYQDLVNILTSMGSYSGSNLYDILNILNVSSGNKSGSNYLYDILYPLSNVQLNSILTLLSPADFYNIFSTFDSAQIIYTLGYLSSAQLYNLLSQLTPAQLYNILSRLNQNDLYSILTTTLSSTDLYNLFSGANYNIFQQLVGSLNTLQKGFVWASYWLGQNGRGDWLFPGNSTSTQTYFLPPGSNPNNPSHGNNSSFPTQPGLPGPGNGNGGNNPPPSPGSSNICTPNNIGGGNSIYNCNINIAITTQAPNGPQYQQSGGVSVTVAP